MADQYGLGAWWRARSVLHRLLVGALAAALLVLLVVVVLADPPPEEPGITKEQYERWRSECVALVTERLDTAVFEVGGRTWTDQVNKCMVDKATD